MSLPSDEEEIKRELYLHLPPPESEPLIDQRVQLVGAIISDRSLHVPSVIRILTNAWLEFGRFQMELLSGSSVFSITAPSAATALNLLEKGPWSVMGNNFIIHPLAPQQPPCRSSSPLDNLLGTSAWSSTRSYD